MKRHKICTREYLKQKYTLFPFGKNLFAFFSFAFLFWAQEMILEAFLEVEFKSVFKGFNVF